MSREIKLRIWDNDKDEWLSESDDDALTYYGFHLIGECMTVQSPSKWTVNGTVEQYTGLKDKNGKEIYEGDIINVFGTGIAQVIDSPSGEWMLYYMREPDEINNGFVSVIPKNKPSGLWKANITSYIEVIGNIHENPELLEGRK